MNDDGCYHRKRKYWESKALAPTNRQDLIPVSNKLANVRGEPYYQQPALIILQTWAVEEVTVFGGKCAMQKVQLRGQLEFILARNVVLYFFLLSAKELSCQQGHLSPGAADRKDCYLWTP